MCDTVFLRDRETYVIVLYKKCYMRNFTARSMIMTKRGSELVFNIKYSASVLSNPINRLLDQTLQNKTKPTFDSLLLSTPGISSASFNLDPGAKQPAAGGWMASLLSSDTDAAQTPRLSPLTHCGSYTMLGPAGSRCPESVQLSVWAHGVVCACGMLQWLCMCVCVHTQPVRCSRPHRTLSTCLPEAHTPSSRFSCKPCNWCHLRKKKSFL